MERMIGRKIIKVEGLEIGSEDINFHTEGGNTYRMYHDQSCCETVELVDICGDINDLIGGTVVSAKCVESDGDGSNDETMYTFYDICTNKGAITLRWHGASNGWYSVSVSFKEIV